VNPQPRLQRLLQPIRGRCRADTLAFSSFHLVRPFRGQYKSISITAGNIVQKMNLNMKYLLSKEM
jgi:hypothetical protein